MKQLTRYFFIFIVLNIFLYTGILFFHSKITLNRANYPTNHHYKDDPQIYNKPFQLIPALGQMDAQWYLKISQKGYPYHPKNIDLGNKKIMDGLTYAFFPLYPMLISVLNLFISPVEMSAFVLSNIIMVLNFFSLYYIVTNLFDKNVATKTIFLLFFFPFSIFFRSYFTEGLYLFLLIWFSYFFVTNKFIFASFFLGLLNVTKINGILLNVLFSYYLFKSMKINQRKIELLTSLFFIIVPFFIWICFNYFQTGNFFYFYSVQSLWYPPHFYSYAFIYKIQLIIHFFELPIHTTYLSKIDIMMTGFFLVLIFKSKNVIMKKLWWVSLLLFLTPLLVKDFSAFSRYQSVSFPCFIYLAIRLKNKWSFLFVEYVFLVSLFITSIFFVNWYWIG